MCKILVIGLGFLQFGKISLVPSPWISRSGFESVPASSFVIIYCISNFSALVR